MEEGCKIFKSHLITIFRLKNRMTIKDFCKKADISLVTHQRIMRQDPNIPFFSLLNIAELMGITLQELFYEEIVIKRQEFMMKVKSKRRRFE